MFAIKSTFLYAVISSCVIVKALTGQEVTSFNPVFHSEGSERELLRRSYNEYFQKALNVVRDVEVVANSLTDLTGKELKETINQYMVDFEGLMEQLKEMQKVPELQTYVGTLAILEKTMGESLRMLKHAVWKSNRRKGVRGLVEVLANAAVKSIELVEGTLKAVTDITADLTSRTVQSGVDFMEGVAAASKTIIYGVKKEEDLQLKEGSRKKEKKQKGLFTSLFGKKNKHKRGSMDGNKEIYYLVDD